MKIVFLTRRFYPDIGGVEKHCLEIKKRLEEKGHEVLVISERDFNLKVGERLKKFPIWFWLWRNRRILKEADIIHCHDVFFWYWPFIFLWPRKKVFVTFHGWEGRFPPTFRAKLMRKIAEKLSWGNICVGDYIGKWYGTKPDWVTYGGVDVNPTKENKRDLIITFVGRLDKDTGYPIYSEAAKILKKKYPQLSVNFLDKEKNIQPYLTESRFVFASGYLSMLEAMSGRRLVLAVYDNPLKKDYLKMSPFSDLLVISESAPELAEKIEFYLAHPQEEKIMVEKAYNWASKQTWDKVVEIYIKLWSKNR